MTHRNAYQQLEQRFRRIHLLKSIGHLLRWDGEVMMPSGSTGIRAEQLALLETESNSILRSKRTGTLLERAESNELSLDEWQKANLREMRRLWRHANAIPNRLVNAFHRATTKAEMQWRRALAQDDYGVLAPDLETVIAVVREKGQILGDVLHCAPYDALLDEYDPGRTGAEVNRIVRTIKDDVPSLIVPIRERQSTRQVRELTAPIPITRQKDLGRKVMKAIGFPFHKGRLDESLHPFTEGTAEDIRVTSRFDKENFLTGLMGVLHETGHAMYDYGLPAQWATQPVGRDRGMAIHESQALFMEMMIGRSESFMRFCAPIAGRIFGTGGDQWSAENLYALATRVEPSLIRMDADEVTYPLHLLLRWELEQDLFSGELKVRDLEEAWREKMRLFLGVVPDKPGAGCLQDSHWPMGYFGYFSTYLMGLIIAAQLFAVAQRDNPAVMLRLESGDFSPIIKWLERTIYCQAAKLTTADLVLQATGETPNPDHFLDYLRNKYLLS
jgi:carboxypeptidase Taq